MSATIYHVVETHRVTDPNEIHRRIKVLDSWRALYAGGVVPLPYMEGLYKRDARAIGDKRALPYLKDLLQHGLDGAMKDTDIVMMSNDDLILHPGLPRALARHIALWEVCSGHRCEFHYRKMPAMTAPAEYFAECRESHIGRDLFAFTKGWLKAHLHEIPDFILGASDWDLCLAWLIRLKKGFPAKQEDLAEVIAPCELTPGYVIHEWHRASWTLPDNVMVAPSQKHNRRLFMEWTTKRGMKLTWDWAVDGGAPEAKAA